MKETKAMIDHRFTAIKSKDHWAMLSDYTDETAIYFPGTELVVADRMRPFAEQFIAEFSAPGSHFTITEMQIDRNIACRSCSFANATKLV